jgi:hypothetical protein
MVKPKRTPPVATARPPEKGVRRAAVQSLTFPSWRFSTVDKAGPFAWPINDAIEQEILQKLHNFDSMRWNKIEGPDHHLINRDKLTKEANERLLKINQDDVGQLFSFHFDGKARIFGIRDNGVVKLLWWDPEHKVCISHKKHT